MTRLDALTLAVSRAEMCEPPEVTVARAAAFNDFLMQKAPPAIAAAMRSTKTRNGAEPEGRQSGAAKTAHRPTFVAKLCNQENSMSKNMVERVARGIWTAPITGQPLGGEVRPWPPTDPDALTETYNQARAAIEAMASPTEAMVEAAHIAEPNPVLGGYALEEDGPGTIWNAMITAALKP